TLPKVSIIDDLVFTGTRTGWMIGDYKHLYRTSDGGISWQETIKGKGNLNSICFSDLQHGWVSGQHGVIYNTSDGGDSWNTQTSSTRENLDQILFVDVRHGWAIGGSAAGSLLDWEPMFLVTKNGGETWTRIKSAPPLRAIAFVDGRHGWGVGLGNRIYHTSDG